jgi:putative two-component system response regulator
MAAADVYDALTSKRVYKNAYSHEIARSIIVEESGTHFDPAIVEAFQACEQEFLGIRGRYAEAVAAA